MVLNLPEFILFLPRRGRVLWLDQTHVVVHRTLRVWGGEGGLGRWARLALLLPVCTRLKTWL